MSTNSSVGGATTAERLYNWRDLSRMFGVSHDTIKRWAGVGQLPPPVTVGRKAYWRREQIDAFLGAPAAAK